MRRGLAVAAGLALALAGCAAGPGPGSRNRPEDRLQANPSGVVAAELAFAREAQEKGQWTAFARSADDDAVMFVPQAVAARKWLQGRANPAQAVRWQPHQVWSSCDGTLAVTKGAWQRPDGSVGYFTTVWERQRNGEYKWVLDQGDTLQQALAEPEMIGGSVGQCPAGGPSLRNPRNVRATIRATACDSTGRCSGGGSSDDGTLAYDYVVAPSGAREVAVQLRQDGAMHEVLRSQVAAE